MPGAGFNKSTGTISNPCLVNASLVSKGKLGVDMITSGYLEPACFRLSFNTRAAGKYELFVRSVTYAFLDSIPNFGEQRGLGPGIALEGYAVGEGKQAGYSVVVGQSCF